MFLYMIQHGEAVSKDIDPERSLSDRGVVDVKKVAAYAAAHCKMMAGADIVHSGKLRAKQTAEIFAETLGLSDPEQSDGLKPMDDPAIWQRRFSAIKHDRILVGHLPYTRRLGSLLLTGNMESDIIQFRMGGIVALRREEEIWSLQWQLIPDIV